MKDLIIKNIDEMEPKAIERDGNKFLVKQVVGGDDIDTCEVAFVEVPVGKYAFGYHFHDQSEEVFYVVRGKGKLRCAYGEKDVKAGDILCFPTGEKGSHVLSNASDTEPLVFIDFDVRASKIDVVTFPDMKKLWVQGAHVNAMVDIPE